MMRLLLVLIIVVRVLYGGYWLRCSSNGSSLSLLILMHILLLDSLLKSHWLILI